MKPQMLTRADGQFTMRSGYDVSYSGFEPVIRATRLDTRSLWVRQEVEG